MYKSWTQKQISCYNILRLVKNFQRGEVAQKNKNMIVQDEESSDNDSAEIQNIMSENTRKSIIPKEPEDLPLEELKVSSFFLKCLKFDHYFKA